MPTAAQHPLGHPPSEPHTPLSSFSVLGNVTQGGKFHQAAAHLVKLTKDLCIVCLILGHLEIPILKPHTKSHKSHFHLDTGLLFAPNAPWQAAGCFQITALWSPHSKGIWNSRLLVVSRGCQVALSSLPFTWHPAGVYLCSHVLVWNSKIIKRGSCSEEAWVAHTH